MVTASVNPVRVTVTVRMTVRLTPHLFVNMTAPTFVEEDSTPVGKCVTILALHQLVAVPWPQDQKEQLVVTLLQVAKMETIFVHRGFALRCMGARLFVGEIPTCRGVVLRVPTKLRVGPMETVCGVRRGASPV